MRDVAHAQFTSKATAADCYVVLGFVPVSAEIVIDIDGSTPSPWVLRWFNESKLTNWTAAVALKQQNVVDNATTGNSSQAKVAALVDKHAGGSTADGTTSYVDRTGAALTSGKVTGPGLLIKAAAQVNSGKNLIKAYRDDI